MLLQDLVKLNLLGLHQKSLQNADKFVGDMVTQLIVDLIVFIMGKISTLLGKEIIICCFNKQQNIF